MIIMKPFHKTHQLLSGLSKLSFGTLPFTLIAALI